MEYIKMALMVLGMVGVFFTLFLVMYAMLQFYVFVRGMWEYKDYYPVGYMDDQLDFMYHAGRNLARRMWS